MEKTIKGIKDFYYKLVWESNANTMQERSDFVGQVLEKYPELVIKSRPDSSKEELPVNDEDGSLDRNVYGRILDYYNDWIFNGHKESNSTSLKSYYNDYKDYLKSIAKESMHINNENEEVIEKRFRESNNSYVQNLNSRIDDNKYQISQVQLGLDIKVTNRRILSDNQDLLKKDREMIFNNSHSFKDMPMLNRGEGLSDKIDTLDLSLSDPETIYYLFNLSKNELSRNGCFELLDLKIELECIIKSCNFSKNEELIIRLKSAHYKYTEDEIAKLLGISRQTIRNRYSNAINKIAVKSGFFKTANI